MMTEQQITHFFDRIDRVTPAHKPKFGAMNAHQMICHCTDQIRLALGTVKAEEYGKADPKEIIALAKAGKTVPVAKGLGQLEGGGTPPGNFKDDVDNLKNHITEFAAKAEDFDFKPHHYFGEYTKEQWSKMTVYHLNHHLKQFGV